MSRGPPTHGYTILDPAHGRVVESRAARYKGFEISYENREVECANRAQERAARGARRLSAVRHPCGPTMGEGRGLIHPAEEGFLRCLAAPPRPHDALPGAAARDCGHLGAPTPRGPVAFPLPAAVLPDARPRPLHMSPGHPPRREMLPESPCTAPLRLPLPGGRGRSAPAHLHAHITPHAQKK